MFSRILLAVDSSDNALRAVDYVVALREHLAWAVQASGAFRAV